MPMSSLKNYDTRFSSARSLLFSIDSPSDADSLILERGFMSCSNNSIIGLRSFVSSYGPIILARFRSKGRTAEVAAVSLESRLLLMRLWHRKGISGLGRSWWISFGSFRAHWNSQASWDISLDPSVAGSILPILDSAYFGFLGTGRTKISNKKWLGFNLQMAWQDLQPQLSCTWM